MRGRKMDSCTPWLLATAWIFSFAVQTSTAYSSVRSRCPDLCSSLGSDPAAWTYYHTLQVFQTCNQTILFDTNLYTSVSDPDTHISIRACALGTSPATSSTSTSQRLGRRQYPQNNSTATANSTSSNNTSSVTSAQVTPLSWSSTDSGSDSSSAAIAGLAEYVTGDSNPSNPSIILTYSGGAVAGVYVGPGIDAESAGAVVNFFAGTSSSQAQRAVQWCGAVNGSADRQSFGLVVLDTQGVDAIASVQSILGKWASGACVDGDEAADNSWWSKEAPLLSTTPASGSTNNATETRLAPRDTCSYIQAESGDGCDSLATRCGITVDELESYNGGASFCDDIEVDQYVCCSSGSEPDFSPQPSANGTCYTYTVQANDTCSSIATAYLEDVSAIEDNNNQTWGWMGCSDLLIGQKICLSAGDPPFPATVSNAVCGPQANDTAYSSNVTGWSDLNPCPLNACCDIWGQCGITSDFCTDDPADTGAPGTAQPGSNGCISNSGTNVIESVAPAEFYTVGYFEAWNTERPCLHMWPQDIPAKYTHVHFAFANISDAYEVDLGDYEDMFEEWQAKTGFKHILSFGGWAFSTSPETYPIFRDGVTAAQRDTFAANVVQFVQDNGLDGVDFDWEYPGATDIPGIPAGSPDDGANYLAFLQDLRERLPTDQYTISIAAPASYWYLRNFPIQEISDVVDYIVYMTYDLHGQWDYDNAYSDPGCPDGNCLRSQVNKTETLSALSMITKAGVPSNMIMVGQALYGRSFEMTEAGCYTAMCTYVGPDSGATPGQCTETAGYISNWEIQQILDEPTSDAQQYYSDEAGDIMVYNKTQWVSYMTTDTYDSRVEWVQGMNFGGTSDWAMDLQDSYYSNGTEVGVGSGVVYIDPDIFTESDPTIACLPPCTFVLPPWILPTMTTISQVPVTETLEQMWTSLTTNADGITSTVYLSSTITTTITIPAVVTDTISVYNVEWTDVDETIIYFTSSVSMPETVLTEASYPVTTGTSSTTLAGILWTYKPGPYSGPSQTQLETTSTTPTTTPNPPPAGSLGSVHVTSGSPKPTCSSLLEIGCGTLCESNCVLELPCVGICGCIGLGCPDGGGCVGDGCGGSDGGDDGDSSSSTTSCETTYTVTDCQVQCSVTNLGTATTTDCYSTSCEPTAGCSPTGTTTTSATTTYDCYWTTALTAGFWSVTDDDGDPPLLGAGGQFGYTYITGADAPTAVATGSAASYIDCDFYGQDPDEGVNTAYCVCAGATFAPATTAADPGNSCAYTVQPTSTFSVGTQYVTATSNCEVCTWAGENEVGCSLVAGCTRTVVVTSTTTVTPTTTVTVVVAPSATADCAYWDDGFFFLVEIYNIDGWATDDGAALKKQEGGCGALTGWEWDAATDSEYAKAYFNLPLTIKAGCIERAVVSAGGPKLSCSFLGVPGLRRRQRHVGESDLLLYGRSVTMTLDTPSPLSITSTPNYTYASTDVTSPYVPMTWNSSDGATVTLTWTITEVTSVLITTDTVVSVGSTMPISSTSTLPTIVSSKTPSSSSSSTISTPTPTQSGMVSDCDIFHLVVAGDTCYDLAQDNNISLDDFYAWNPAVGDSCAGLDTGYYVCVGVVNGTTSSATPTSTAATTTSATSSGNGVATPTPTEPGMVDDCDAFHYVVSGDSCSSIADDADITLDDFYAWNTEVGSTCSDLWLDAYVCVGVLA